MFVHLSRRLDSVTAGLYMYVLEASTSQLHAVVERLTLRFSACPSWGDNAGNRVLHKPPQIAWHLLTSDPHFAEAH